MDDGGVIPPRSQRRRAPSALSRRTFLRGIGAGAIATFLVACADALPSTTPLASRPGGSAAPSTPAPSSVSATTAPTTPATVSPGPDEGPFPEPDLRTKIAQMLLVGFRGSTVKGAAQTVVDIRDRGLGGVLLFDYDTPTKRYHRNISSPGQVRALIAGLRDAASIPLLVAIDEEGGEVDRLKARYGFPATVSEAALGTREDIAYTRKRAKAIGETLAGLGIDLDLAPVVDLDVNPTNPVIGALERSFSADPKVVTRQGLAYLAGLHDAGVGGTLKHFPGHGSSTADTHLGWVDVTKTWTTQELEPFRAIIAKGAADAVLVAHVFDSKLDPTYPASLSGAVIDGMLRGDLGFEGVVITDDLQMGAIRQVYGYETAVERAILAGADILTIANEQVYEPGIVTTTIDIVEAAVDGRPDRSSPDRRIMAADLSAEGEARLGLNPPVDSIVLADPATGSGVHLCETASWSAQPLPSGSLKNTNLPHGYSSISDTWTPRPASSARAAATSDTTICRPCAGPGSWVEMPTPKAMEQADPGGVICTNRSASFTWWSWSAWKPTCSV